MSGPKTNKVKWTLVTVAMLCQSCSGDGGAVDNNQLLANFRERVSSRLLDPEKPEHIGGEWHFKFKTVKAYRMNWHDADAEENIVEEGKLNETRMPKEGVVLTQPQIDRLEAAVTGTHPDYSISMCMMPHHAFVFFDEGGKVVGSLDVCFGCLNHFGQPTGFQNSVDLVAIAELFDELGVPLHNSNWHE